MLLSQAVRVILTAMMVWEGTSEAATMAAVKICGRQLSEIMSRVCHAFNSPWDVPTGLTIELGTHLDLTSFVVEVNYQIIVVEQPGSVARRKRQLGIADECCIIGCTWEQLSEYCSISAFSESPLEDLEEHIIEDRSAESGAKGASSAVSGREHSHATSRERRREVGRKHASRGYGRARCWCRRKRRSGRRRADLMGNMELVKNVRAAPVVGTVSPLITWGRTLNTDLPTAAADRDRYAYVVYT